MLLAVQVAGINRQAGLEIGKCTIEMPQFKKVHGAPQVGGGVLGIVSDRCIQLFDRPQVRPVGHRCLGQHRVGHRQAGIQFERLLGCRARPCVVVDTISCQPAGGHALGCGQCFPGIREIRVELRRFFQHLGTGGEILAGQEQAAALQVQVVSVKVLGCGLDGNRFQSDAQFAFQGVNDGVGDFVLDRKDVIQFAVESIGPQVAIIGCIDQLGRDAHPVAGLAHAAFEDVVDLQFLGDGRNVQVLALVYERRSARCHLEPIDTHQQVQQFLGNAVGKVFLFRVVADVQERQHCDGGFDRGQSPFLIFGTQTRLFRRGRKGL